MNYKLLKRIENLLSLGLDKSTTCEERENATKEALREVKLARRSTADIQWSMFPAMRHFECSECGKLIKPLERAWRGVTPREEKYRHDKCHQEAISPT